jgi:hypothetical protein
LPFGPSLEEVDTGSSARFERILELIVDRLEWAREEADTLEGFEAACLVWVGETADRMASANGRPGSEAPDPVLADTCIVRLGVATSIGCIALMQAQSPVEGVECS